MGTQMQRALTRASENGLLLCPSWAWGVLAIPLFPALIRSMNILAHKSIIQRTVFIVNFDFCCWNNLLCIQTPLPRGALKTASCGTDLGWFTCKPREDMGYPRQIGYALVGRAVCHPRGLRIKPQIRCCSVATIFGLVSGFLGWGGTMQTSTKCLTNMLMLSYHIFMYHFACFGSKVWKGADWLSRDKPHWFFLRGTGGCCPAYIRRQCFYHTFA